MDGARAGQYFSPHWPNRTTPHGTAAVTLPAFYTPLFLFGFPFFEDP